MRNIKPVIQSEAAECGLTCLLMILDAHGHRADIQQLRAAGGGIKGTTLEQLIALAGRLSLSARALSVPLEALGELQLPCILHWDLNHFVILRRIRGRRVEIIDPAVGRRRMSIDEISRHFTGIALELEPTSGFKLAEERRTLKFSEIAGEVRGLWRSLGQIAAIAIGLEAFAVVAPLLQQLVVDDVLTSGDGDLLTVLVIGFGLLLLIQTVIGLIRSWMVVVLSQSLALQWTSNVFGHLIKLPIVYFERRHLGDITSRFGAIETIQRSLTSSVIEALLDGLMAAVTLVMMLIYAPTLAAITFGAVVIYGLLRWLSYSPVRDASAERLIIAGQEHTNFLETLRGMTPIKLFGREDERRLRWSNLMVEVQNRDLRTARLSMAFGAANTLVFGLENLLVLWIGARLILGTLGGATVFQGDHLTVGMLFAYLSYKGQFTGRVSALINHMVDLKMLGLHAERLSDIVLEPPERDDVPFSTLEHLESSIELRNVSFRYGESEPWILRNANLKIEAGESVALVGASGAGKTTLMKILLGLLPPAEGEVLYGGLPVKQLGLRNVRRCIGAVMQDDVLLTGSLAHNISFFDIHPNQELIEECAKLAQLHQDISRMPMGYHTLVGDLGSGLSGGQKQRLLLARALYKRPKILVLDEATSHLDVAGERAVTAAIAHMKMTRFVLAHRPETIAGAQRIVRMVASPSGGQVHDVARVVPLGASTEI